MNLRGRYRKKVDFGFGYSVPITFKDRVISQGVPVAGVTTFVSKSKDNTTIEIDQKDPLCEQIDTYGHEIIHAAIEFHRWLVMTYVLPLREEAVRTEERLKKEEDA